MAGDGGRVSQVDVMLLSGCAIGAVWSLAGALAAFLEHALAPVVPPPAGGGWFPLWSALLSVPAAVAGAGGGIMVARRGWHPAMRALEGATLAAVALMVIQISGGYAFPQGAPLWAALAASAPAYQVVGAWGLAARLAQPLVALSIRAEAAMTDAPALLGAVYGVLRNRLLILAIGTGGAWAAASYAAAGDPGAGGALSLVGGAGLATGGIVFLARLHQRLINLELRREGARISPGLEGGLNRGSLWLLLAPALLALLLPTNFSPLKLWHFNRWMERLTERLGPLLVPSQAPGRRVGEELGRFSIDRMLGGFAGRGGTGGGSGGSFFFWALVLAILAWVAWRIFRTHKRGERPVGMGRLPLGLGWLYEELRAAIARFFVRLGWGRRVVKRAGSRSGSRAAHVERVRQRPGRGGRRSVTAIYLDVLARMSRRGMLRRESETPLEFLGRLNDQSAAGNGSLSRLTDLYLAERYAGRRPTATILDEARRAGADALRALGRGRIAAAVRSLVRR